MLSGARSSRLPFTAALRGCDRPVEPRSLEEEERPPKGYGRAKQAWREYGEARWLRTVAARRGALPKGSKSVC